MNTRIKDAFFTALIAGVLALPLAGARTIDGAEGLTVEWHLVDVGVAALLIFLGRLLLGLIADGKAKWIAPLAFVAGIVAAYLPFPSQFLKSVAMLGAFVLAARAAFTLLRRADIFNAMLVKLPHRPLAKNLAVISAILILFTLVFPFTPLASRYALDVAIMVMTYIMLAWGLNITVGYAGLLDLGYAGFYALGAYSYALLAQNFGLSFWEALPISGGIAALAAFLLGFPVLRLRGDYFAIVTLGFGEIVRLVLINWTKLTNGPNGISGIPRPTFVGLEFARDAAESRKSFHGFFSLEFDPLQRVIFLYYLILLLALLVGWFSAKLRRLPIGRAWEAFREDEVACAALGINRSRVKLAAYALGATVAGLAGAFFATRQGFISPESFTFTESATMLAIVILGGIGHPLGIVFAAVFIVGMPELFRDLEQYRMLAFGAGMVLIMLWRPGGMMAVREPTVKLPKTA
ncbi:MAG: high-affinity branched-chain amino acid ABC transporter permease LivM [Alphaproteobacteria bacterium]|nr:high-affinity branched-chain amino acid ABC transporter permease LivM [Alphaproteobacteria bacterium]